MDCNEDIICQLCNQIVSGIVFTKVYGLHSNGVACCVPCYNAIQQAKLHPYSQVMERMAMLETGYHANRKIATSRTAAYHFQ
jgi:hypothetical protein